ncbi:MAG TPA: prepilin-type N-terminal cleavage/methylation domain-containing protein [Lentisphaeria bacterium]|nr:prepilin-type N-terminal cleavage/methylation domain-containing protein [Lentisphaeria bacterium]
MTSGFSRLGLPFAVKRADARRRWFTLIEIIIAATIFLLIAVALFTYSSETGRSWSKIVVERNRFNELLVLDRALDTILRHAVPFVWTDRETELNPEVPFIVATGDVLRCAYLHRLNSPEEGAIRFVELSVRDNNLVATYSDRPFLYWGDVAEREWTSVLATDVSAVSFRYADWNADASDVWSSRLFWRDEWETVESERTDLPLAILVTVHWQDGRVESWLRRSMGSGYRERYGRWEAVDEDR